jgi:hypothetical protein
LTTPPSSRQADTPATDNLSSVTAPSGKPPLQRAIAQRFSALATWRQLLRRGEMSEVGCELEVTGSQPE